jgi:hypothetical protein
VRAREKLYAGLATKNHILKRLLRYFLALINQGMAIRQQTGVPVIFCGKFRRER